MYEELKLVGNICEYYDHLDVFHIIFMSYMIMLIT